MCGGGGGCLTDFLGLLILYPVQNSSSKTKSNTTVTMKNQALTLITSFVFSTFAFADLDLRLKPGEVESEDVYFTNTGSSYDTSSSLSTSNNEDGRDYEREVLIRFPDVWRLPSKVNSAGVYLFCTRIVEDYGYMKLNVREPKSSWKEKSVTFKNKPASASKFYEKIDRNKVDKWVYLDVEDFYDSLRSNDRGVHLVARNKEAVTFLSSDQKEFTGRPEFVVTIPFPDLVCPLGDNSGNSQSITRTVTGSDFGSRWPSDRNPTKSVKGYRLLHTGIDISNSTGTSTSAKVFAMHDGVIYNTNRSASGNGGYLSVRYDVGAKDAKGNNIYVTSSYLHIVPKSTLSDGSKVVAGQQIGSIFDLNKASGGVYRNHLHVQIRYGGHSEIVSSTGYNIVTGGRLPESKDNTKYLEEDKYTGELPAFPEFFINLSSDVDWK